MMKNQGQEKLVDRVDLEKYQHDLKKIIVRLDFVVKHGDLTLEDASFIDHTLSSAQDLSDLMQKKIEQDSCDMKQETPMNYYCPPSVCPLCKQ